MMETAELQHDKHNAGSGPIGNNTGKYGSNSQALLLAAGTLEMLGNQEIIQRVTAESLVSDLQGRYQMNGDIEFQDKASEIGFGVELEVFYNNIDNMFNSVKEANEKKLTDAHKRYSGNGGPLCPKMFEYFENRDKAKWSVVEDRSLQVGGDERGQWGSVGLEWVSPVLRVAKASWAAIKEVCGCITRHTGKILDTCSEHIHVGHKTLEGDKNKFDSLFAMYQAFQDVIEIYALSGQGRMRSRADIYAKTMEMEKPFTEPFENAGFLEHWSFNKLETILAFVAIPEAVPEEDAENEAYREFLDWFIGENDNIRILERDWLRREILTGNEKIMEAGASDRHELINMPELYETVIRLQEIAEKFAIMTSYIEHFGGNPFWYLGRQRAVNVHQNFTTTKQKPTVEFRRFNGTLSPDVVQANALLTACLMKTAMEKSGEMIAAAIEAARLLNPSQKVTAFVDLITDDDNIKRVLLEAYMANLNEEQRGGFREAHRAEESGEGEAL